MAWREEVREALLPWGWRPERVVKRGCGGGRGDDDVCGSSVKTGGGGGMAATGDLGGIGLLEVIVLPLARSSSNGALEAALSISCISKLFR